MSNAAYDDIADWYNDYLGRGILATDLDLKSLLELVGDVSDQQICDLACGQGRVSRELARRGAIVTGVDISVRLIEIAIAEEQKQPLGITYLVDNAQSLVKLKTASFGGVVCNMAFTDILDLKASLVSVHRILSKNGWLTFSLAHPCFQAPHTSWQKTEQGQVVRQVPDYFQEGFWRSNNPNGVRGKVGAYHRTLTTYFNALIETGFVIERILEPQAASQTSPESDYTHIPAFLIVRCHKK